MLRGPHTLFVAGYESPRSLRTGLRIGVENPAELTSPGRALLALLPPDELPRLLGPDAVTPELEQALAETRRQGYSLNIGNVEPDVTAIGAAVIDIHGRTRGALAVGGPTSRFPENNLPWVGQAVRKAAADLGAELT